MNKFDSSLKQEKEENNVRDNCTKQNKILELDLDYLERGGVGTLSVGAPSVEPSPDSLDLVKVVLLGAPAVGKTSIIQQFVWSDFSEEYMPTDKKQTFYPSVIINEHLYEVKITDVPVIPYFPINSYYEWAHYRFYGLRNATAYILVFDLSNVETFQYIRTLRDQMVESRDMRNVPVLVVGNKQDLLCSTSTSAASGLQQLAMAESACTDSREKRRNIVNLVRKHWKCGYVECSAKYNWRVIAVFKELMEMIDALEWSGGGRSSEPPPDSSTGGELDLDYLERGGVGTLSVGAPSVEPSPDSLDLVKVVLLGAPAVGKTSIIQQFVWSDFSEEYIPTDKKQTFYPSVIINEHLYEVKITDVPVIPYFPINSYYEWAHYRFYGLRNATAYILVFDLSNVETFQYIRTLRDQMVESRDMRNVPVLVVGNKQDLLCSTSTSAASGLQQLAMAESACTDSREKRRNIVNLVRKHWKCGYVECSAKYNWRVIAVFKELMEMIDALEWSGGGRSSEPPPDSSTGGGISHEHRCVVA